MNVAAEQDIHRVLLDALNTQVPDINDIVKIIRTHAQDDTSLTYSGVIGVM